MRGFQCIGTLFFLILHFSIAKRPQTCTLSVKDSCAYTCGFETYLLGSVPVLTDVQRCRVGNSTLVYSVCGHVECGGHSNIMVCQDDTVPLINRSNARVLIDRDLNLLSMYFQPNTSYQYLHATIILNLHETGSPACLLGTRNIFNIFIKVENVPTPTPAPQGWASACNRPCVIVLSVLCVVGISLITALVVVAVCMRRRRYTPIEATSKTQRTTMVYMEFH